MRALKLGLLVVSLTAAVPAVAANFLCCTDDRGKQACGDILPSVCVGRAYREIGPGGAVIRQVEAPLTAEQRAQRAAEEERKKEAEAAAKEQARLDQALLNTYGSEADIDLARQRAEADTVATIKSAEAKIVDARKRRKKFEDEAEFYRKKSMPPELAKALKENDAEILAQQTLIETKTKDLEAIRARYDDDKRRYHELRQSPKRRQP
ncbi:MAG TPA: hypothetical protein VFY24_16840 [Azospira sp.]|nr:hypothetical protein [Azospira sp.]